MSDFLAPLEDSDQAYGILTIGGAGSPVGEVAANSGTMWTTAGTSAWPSANLAVFAPVVVRRRVVVSAMAWWNGSGVSGNLDAGIYDRNRALLGHTGSTAQAGASALQSAAISGGPITLNPGLYYLALACDNITSPLPRASLSIPLLQACGYQQMASAFPLPSTATFANPTAVNAFIIAAQTGPTI
jgi:hypothetical protein